MNYNDLVIQEGIINDSEYAYNGKCLFKISLLNFGINRYQSLKVFVIFKGLINIERVDTNLEYTKKDKCLVFTINCINSNEYKNALIYLKEIGFCKWFVRIIVLNKYNQLIYRKEKISK